uniref:Alpha-2-macroglobulin-like protein 1 n=1 Tax=Cairina moschata TaxID=8855 RepID=A0A8C3BDJ5_CAIMO
MLPHRRVMLHIAECRLNPSTGSHYMVVFPAVIHHSQEEKLCIHLSSLTEAVHLAVTLEMETKNHTLVEQDVEKPGTFECITFQVPELTPWETDASASQSEEVVFLHVLIHSDDSVLFEGRKKVLVKPQKNVILVETDKALYKPGETVKFRIVNLDNDLKVIKNEYRQIWLLDPKHNRIAEWLNVKSRHGIVDLSFPLASEAALGKYTISVQQDMAKNTFVVKEYELTKIELEIEHPPFISTEDEEFHLKLCGKYTYGKPVQGKIDITFLTSLQFFERDFSNSTEMRKKQSRTDKNGCTTFTVKTKTLELTESDSYIYVKGEMEETGTGAKTENISTISIVTRIKSIEFINVHPFYKRGLPYTGKMFYHSDGSPLQNETVYLTIDIDDEETHLSFLTDEKGEVHFSLDTTSWNSTLVSLKGTYYLGNDTEKKSEGIEDSLHWLKPFYSESNSFLEIKAKNDVMPCDQEQEVQVDYILDQNKLSSKADHIDFYYLVIAKGRILFSGEKQVSILQHENLQGSFSFTLTVGNDFLPDIKLLVYALFLDGEVVADVEEFQVATCFKNKLYKTVFEDSFIIGGRGFPYHLEDFDAYPCLPQKSGLHKKTHKEAPWYQSEADVFNLFKMLRMKILTNTKIKKPVSCIKRDFKKKMLSSKDGIVDNYVGHADSVPQSDDTEKPKPRTHFPETWIWDLVPVGVFQPFFVDLSLPYSVTRGETFSLKATVFNYLKDCIQVHTTLKDTPELKVEACPGCQFTSCLCANETQTFVWNVTATRLGKVNITVSSVAEDSHNLCDNQVAVTPLRGKTDTVTKPLLVKPEGVLQKKTQNAYLCATDNTVSEEFSLTLPAETLEGSGRATFSVIGDIMGPALQNLGQLLEMPFGCGEQNMVQFAPNIFILEYLQKTKQLDPEIENTALYFLITGYQRQLLYKHDDGSYSAFGKADTQGNTWLTAFVARSFGQASSHIYIDKDHVQDAVLWLRKHQLPSGCFQSVGKLFNNDLKGGVDDTLSLTAYITAALVELHLEKNDTMLDNALHCLKNVTIDETNLYVKALMAYVFTLTKDMEMRQQLLDKLEKETAEHLTSDSSSKESSSSMIETVAYILLAHVSNPDLAVNENTASKLVHWLSEQRNARGGFASTQDTVVSLQALSQYAALFPQEMRNFQGRTQYRRLAVAVCMYRVLSTITPHHQKQKRPLSWMCKQYQENVMVLGNSLTSTFLSVTLGTVGPVTWPWWRWRCCQGSLL